MMSCWGWYLPVQRRGLEKLHYSREQTSATAHPEKVDIARTVDNSAVEELPVLLTSLSGKGWNLRVPASISGRELRCRAAAETGFPAEEVALSVKGCLTVVADDDAPCRANGKTGCAACVELQITRVVRRPALAGSANGRLTMCHVSMFGQVVSLDGCHEGAVTCVDVDWTSRCALTGSEDRTLKLWDLDFGFCVETLHGHMGFVKCLSVDWSAKRAISGAEDGDLRVWDLGSAVCLAVLRGGDRRVFCLAVDWLQCMYDQSSQHALSGSDDGLLSLWDLKAKTCEAKLAGHRSTVSCLCVEWDNRVAVSGSHDATLRVWNLRHPYESQQLQGHAGAVTCLTVDWDALKAISGSLDGTLKVWDIGSLVCLQTASEQGQLPVCLCLDGNTGQVVSASSGGKITSRLWASEDLLEASDAHEMGTDVRCMALDARGRKRVRQYR